MKCCFVSWFLVASTLVCLTPTEGPACFGARLLIGVGGGEAQQLAGYATGYFVEEKTGIEPDFVEIRGDAEEALSGGEIDLYLASADEAVPSGVESRAAGEVPGFGPGRYWIRPDVLEDLRFFTVGQALGAIHRLFESRVYAEVLRSPEPLRQAARQAVLRGL